MGLVEYRPPARATARLGPALPGALAHVRWIGGPPDAGKSTVARLLAARHDLQRYHFDNWEPRHIARMDPTQQPALHTFCLASMDERWVLRTPEEMAAEAVRAWTERFWMTVEDLLALPREPGILAEGPGLLPECVAQAIADPGQRALGERSRIEASDTGRAIRRARHPRHPTLAVRPDCSVRAAVDPTGLASR